MGQNLGLHGLELIGDFFFYLFDLVIKCDSRAHLFLPAKSMKVGKSLIQVGVGSSKSSLSKICVLRDLRVFEKQMHKSLEIEICRPRFQLAICKHFCCMNHHKSPKPVILHI